MLMARGLFTLLSAVALCAALAPSAQGQFLSDEDRKGMFTVGLSYSMRDYEMEYRGSSAPFEDLEAVYEAFTTDEELDSIELSVAWLSFGYIELRGTIGLVDYNITSTHATDSAFDTALASSDEAIYGLSAFLRYPLNEWLVLGFEVGLMTGRFHDVTGEVSQLDVFPGLTTSVQGIDWRELTVGSKLMLRWGNVLPYVGVRYIDVTTDVDTVLTQTRTGDTIDRTATFDNRNELSGVAGLTWRISPLIMADLEAQLSSNDRLMLTVKFTF
jgi:hypothetical protein